MTEYRLIKAPIAKIVEEESLHMHKFVFKTVTVGDMYKKGEPVVDVYPEFYSVMTLGKELRIQSWESFIKEYFT